MIKDRYIKNIGTIGEEGQRKLLKSHVAVVGAGGLGGTVFEILVRYGVGKITIVDFDSFETTNLNRQLLSSENNLGENKAEAAAKRAASINSSMEVKAVAERLTDSNAQKILTGAGLVCDCLGNISDRFVLERAARELRIPMVHAAIAGERGQLMTITPDGPGLEAIYGEEAKAPKSGQETEAGTPPSSVMAIASLQAHEAIRTIIDESRPRDEILRVDLREMKIYKLKLPSNL
jgi:molybdopterin/thiamine biosynthesis adenylyltransferase